jgi:hypothetical protein
MLDEIKTIDVQYKDRKITLTPDFRAFKKLHKNTGNAFAVMDEFVNNQEKRVEHLPELIKAMAEEDLTIEEIEKNILGMQWARVTIMAKVVFELLDSELLDPIAAEENSKNVQIPGETEN